MISRFFNVYAFPVWVKLRLQLMEVFEEEDKPPSNIYYQCNLWFHIPMPYCHVYLYPFVDKFLAKILGTIRSSIYQNYIVPKCIKFIRSDI
jgi:hypothetical protein